jgi:heat shock protein HslJ
MVVFSFLFKLSYAGSTKTIYVNDRKVSCLNAEGECFQLRMKNGEAWQNFSGKLEGFAYEEGYAYKVKVEVKDPKDFSLTNGDYKVVKVISKTKTGFNPATRLEGKKWVMRAMDDTKSTLTIDDTTGFIKFDIAAGKANGKGVCNTFHTNITTEGSGKITFAPMAVTKMMCGDMTLEKIIFRFIQQANSYTIKGDILILTLPGKETITFKAW